MKFHASTPRGNTEGDLKFTEDTSRPGKTTRHENFPRLQLPRENFSLCRPFQDARGQTRSSLLQLTALPTTSTPEAENEENAINPRRINTSGHQARRLDDGAPKGNSSFTEERMEFENPFIKDKKVREGAALCNAFLPPKKTSREQDRVPRI